MGVFIEHGHQYDTYSSLEHLLYPLLPWNHSKVEWPAVSLAIRHGVNRLAGFTTHEKDDWTSLDYLRFFLTRNPANIPRLIRIYGQLLRRFLSYYINHRRTTLDPIGEIHGQVRRTLAPESGLSQTQLIELEKLHAPPRHLTLIGLINTSFIDRWLLFLFDSLFVVTLLTLDLPWWGWLLAMASMLGWSAAAMRAMDRMLDPYIPPKLADFAARMHDIVKTRYVIMGHSHVPHVVLLPQDNAININTGSWLHQSAVVRHADEHCDCNLTHVAVIINDNAHLDAELRRWCIQARKPFRWSHHPEPR